MAPRRIALIATILGLALVDTGCGSDDGAGFRDAGGGSASGSGSGSLADQDLSAGPLTRWCSGPWPTTRPTSKARWSGWSP